MAFNGAGGVRDERNPLRSGVSRVAFTVAAEASNVIKVTASLKRGLRPNAAPARRQLVRAYLTQNPTTLAVAGTAPDTSVAVSAKGSIVATITSKLVWLIVADANGEFDLNITDATAGNWYLVVEAGGDCFVSDVIDFAQPVVTARSPTGGTTAGGTALTITGTGFESGSTVDIGGAAATGVVVVSATSITCVTPARTAGAKNITVTTPHGVSNTDVQFTYS
jgi:hypothetical protein